MRDACSERVMRRCECDHTCIQVDELLEILQCVYILGPRTNLIWRSSHGESKEEGKEESFEKEVGLQRRRARMNSSLAALKVANSARF